MLFIPILIFTLFGMGHHWYNLEIKGLFNSELKVDIGLLLLVIVLPVYIIVDLVIGVS